MLSISLMSRYRGHCFYEVCSLGCTKFDIFTPLMHAYYNLVCLFIPLFIE